jgi:hypothetical protein
MKTEKQLTAVEQLEKQILDNWMDILIGKVYIGDLFEQAKEMFEKQIIEAYRTGVWDLGCRSADSEEYYNRTFKQEKQCKCGQPKIGGYTCQRTDCNQTFKQQEQ